MLVERARAELIAEVAVGLELECTRPIGPDGEPIHTRVGRARVNRGTGRQRHPGQGKREKLLEVHARAFA
jgi:hypothetical protein